MLLLIPQCHRSRSLTFDQIIPPPSEQELHFNMNNELDYWGTYGKSSAASSSGLLSLWLGQKFELSNFPNFPELFWLEKCCSAHFTPPAPEWIPKSLTLINQFKSYPNEYVIKQAMSMFSMYSHHCFTWDLLFLFDVSLGTCIAWGNWGGVSGWPPDLWLEFDLRFAWIVCPSANFLKFSQTQVINPELNNPEPWTSWKFPV